MNRDQAATEIKVQLSQSAGVRIAAPEQQAFVLRISPSEIDHVAEALEQNQLIIGWANAEGLLNRQLDWESFRNIDLLFR